MLQNTKRKILAIGAHGDDIELACGGTLAKAIDLGHEVKIVVITGSELVSHEDIPIRSKNQAKEEIVNAAKVLGIKDLEILGYGDTEVPYSAKLVMHLDSIINKFNPDIIFTHFVFDTHQDHIRTAHSTISAARRQKNIFLYEPVNPSGQGYIPFRPQIYSDISGYIDHKIKSLEAHKSQLKKYSPRWIDAIVARSKFRGYEMGVEYAECFEIIRSELVL